MLYNYLQKSFVYPIMGYHTLIKKINIIRCVEMILCMLMVAMTTVLMIFGEVQMIEYRIIWVITALSFIIIVLIDVVSMWYQKPIFWNTWIMFATIGCILAFLCAGLCINQLLWLELYEIYVPGIVLYILTGVVFLIDIIIILFFLQRRRYLVAPLIEIIEPIHMKSAMMPSDLNPQLERLPSHPILEKTRPYNANKIIPLSGQETEPFDSKQAGYGTQAGHGTYDGPYRPVSKDRGRIPYIVPQRMGSPNAEVMSQPQIGGQALPMYPGYGMSSAPRRISPTASPTRPISPAAANARLIRTPCQMRLQQAAHMAGQSQRLGDTSRATQEWPGSYLDRRLQECRECCTKTPSPLLGRSNMNKGENIPMSDMVPRRQYPQARSQSSSSSNRMPPNKYSQEMAQNRPIPGPSNKTQERTRSSSP